MLDNSKLNEYDKQEWFDICKHIKPELTWEEFGPMWEEFQLRKAEHIKKASLQ
jgi:hypothetical protein